MKFPMQERLTWPKLQEPRCNRTCPKLRTAVALQRSWMSWKVVALVSLNSTLPVVLMVQCHNYYDQFDL